MLAVVYRCRCEGFPLTSEAVEATGRRGDLRVHRKGMRRVAVLYGADGETYLVPLLDKVRLLAMNEEGLLLTGLERVPPKGAKGQGWNYRQTWWCVVSRRC